MSTLLPFFGVCILLFAAFEVLQTTMGSGGGPLTRRLTPHLWRAILYLSRPRPSHAVLSFAGVLITLAAISAWILLWWVGWTLIFAGPYEAVVNATTNTPATFWERVYFAGFTVYTLGVGDFVPQGTLWRILTGIASGSGLFIVTFSITYLVPIVQAATKKRQLAVYIASIGASPTDMILNTWHGDDQLHLGQHLQTVAPELAGIAQRHLSYPVMHYFHSQSPTAAITVNIARLDEALTMAEFGLEGTEWIRRTNLRPTRQVITEFLNLLESAYVRPQGAAPPAPPLERLSEKGVPVVNRDKFEANLEQLSERRRMLRALVEHNGWRWSDVTPAEPQTKAVQAPQR